MTDQERKLEEKQQKEARKERRDRELEKIRSMHGKARLQYLWDYYKIVLIFVFFALVALSILVTVIRGIGTERVLQVGVISPDQAADDSMIRPDFEQYLGGLKKKQELVFDLSINIQPDADYSQIAQVADVKLQVSVSSGLMDAVLVPEKAFAYLQEKGYFLSLDDLLSPDKAVLYEEKGDLAFGEKPDPDAGDKAAALSEADEGSAMQTEDRQVNSVRQGDMRIYGVRVDDDKVLAKYALYPAGEKIYFAVISNAKHAATALEFLDFLKGEERHE